MASKMDAIKRGLLDEDLRVRLEVARSLSGGDFSPEIIPFLESVLKRETNQWVRSAISNALVNQVRVPPDPEKEDEIVDHESYEELMPIVNWITKILHELKNSIGVIQLNAIAEIGNYEGSQTRPSIDRLSNSISALEKIENITREPSFEEIDLAGLISELRDQFPDSKLVLGGESPYLVRTDRSLIELILVNAIKNAVEASDLTQDPECQEIIINWGSSEKGCFVSLLDRGVGLQAARDPFEFGESGKPGHAGIGLSLSERAAKKLDGGIYLRAREGKGTKFLLEIPRKNA